MMASLIATLLSAAPAPDVTLVRLDCGEIVSDKSVAEGGWDFTNSCYLVKHGSDYLLWDAGLPASIAGQAVNVGGQTLTVRETVATQLERMGVTPDKVKFVGVSHYHFDHSSQAKFFADATLLIGKKDWEALTAANANPQNRNGVLPWLEGKAKVEPVEGDRDVFGDGRVIMIDLPGHTPGHYGLLVQDRGGAVLLSGDQFHQRAQFDSGDVPGNASDLAAARASGARFKALAAEHKARVIIQHDRKDNNLLITLPEFAN